MKKLKLFMVVATCSSFLATSAFAYLTQHPHPTQGHATAAASLECKVHTKNAKSNAYNLKKKRKLPLVRYYYECTNPSSVASSEGKPISSGGKPIGEPIGNNECGSILAKLQREGSLIHQRTNFSEIGWAQAEINKLMKQAIKLKCK